MPSTVKQPSTSNRSEYFLPSGTEILISRVGTPFTPHITQQARRLQSPVLETDDELVFANGDWRILVSRDKVIVSGLNADGQPAA